MIQRAVEISGVGRYLRKERGFLLVCDKTDELGRLPLDDLEIVLYTGHGMTCTGEVLTTLAKRCVPFVICDHRFVPSAILWPVESHHLQAGRIRAQAEMSLPLQKRLWQQVVRAKILGQAWALHTCTGQTSPRLDFLAATVRSGDPANAEGEAARVYWPLLFGGAFRRERAGEGVNVFLNYGYTVLRAAVARATMLAGLHPAFGLYHRNLRDTMPLVDDLIEPFRPLIDVMVYALAKECREELILNAAAKSLLIGVTDIDLISEGETCPVSECLLRLTRSLAEVCEGKRKNLVLPEGVRDSEGG